MQVHSFKRNQGKFHPLCQSHSQAAIPRDTPSARTDSTHLEISNGFLHLTQSNLTQSNDPRSHRISTPPAAVGRHAPACCCFCGHPDLPARSHRLFARRITFVASVAIALRMHTALNSLKKQRLRQFRAGNCNGNAGRPEGGCVNTPTSISKKFFSLYHLSL